MAVNEIIINHEKFFKGFRSSYIGGIVSKNAGVTIYNMNANGPVSSGSSTIVAGSSIKAEAMTGNELYFNATYSSNLINGWFKASEFFQNGGVSGNRLTHLFHGFIAPRKAVAVC